MDLAALILLAFAVSLDGFGVGVAYGLRNLRLPVISLLTIGLASGLAIFATMQAGHLLGTILPIYVTRWLATIILVLVGLWVLWTTVRPSQQPLPRNQPLKISVRAFGFIIQVIREPARADLDESGEISTGEALLLGFALALDALGAGFGAALAGFSALYTPIAVGLFKVALVSGGVQLGKRCLHFNRRVGFLSGGILILLGLANLL